MGEVASPDKQIVLVTGATGQQGGALIRSLLLPDRANLATDYHILALTRNPSSCTAKELSATYSERVTIVQGDLDDPASVRKIFENAKAEGRVGIWGVYSVMAFPGLGASTEPEERQGKLLADIAFEYGVSLFVYSAAELGSEHDDTLEKDSHSQPKVAVERHVKFLGEKGLNWTIIRPGFFMENFLGTTGTIAAGVLYAGLKPETKVPLVAVEDIGRVAALVFKNPEAFKNRVVPVISDNLTVTEQRSAHTRATGRPQPSIPWLAAKLLVMLNSHTQGLIREMERAYLVQLDSPYPPPTYPTIEMTSFESWAAKQASGKVAVPKEGWNGIDIKKLLMGKS